MAKVRLQISTSLAASNLTNTNNAIVYRGLFGTIFGMMRHEGFRSLYGGISPGLQRQCLFASIRIGLYEPVKDFYAKLLQLGMSLINVVIESETLLVCYFIINHIDHIFCLKNNQTMDQLC